MDQFERRRTYRINMPDVWAECSSNEDVGRYQVENLSQGGALLHGEPAFPIRTPLRILLSIPGHRAVRVDGVVTRHYGKGRDTPQLAVEFGHLSDDEQDAIEEAIAGEVIRELSPAILICDARDWEGSALARTIGGLGFTPIQVKTPLGLIRHLIADNPPIRAVVLGMHLRKTRVLDVVSFLAEYYPNVRRILVARPSWRTRKVAAGMVHEIVRKPWTAETLQRALDTL